MPSALSLRYPPEGLEDHPREASKGLLRNFVALDNEVESVREVRDRVLEASEYLPVERLGTCDDCGFSPFADDASTSRDTAFRKVAAHVEGTALAPAALGV